MVYYIYFYTQKSDTYTNSVIQISKFNNINTTRQSFDKHSSLIKLNYLNKIINQFYNIFSINATLIFKNQNCIYLFVYICK